MSLSTMRVQAQVWPLWLPRALARAEQQITNSTALPTCSKQPLPPLLFSASFQSLLPKARDSLSANALKISSQLQQLQPFKPYLQIRTTAIQSRTFSASRSQIRAFTTSPTSPPPVQEEHTDSSTKAAWQPPEDVENRPVAIIGAGVLGRRLAVTVGPSLHLHQIPKVKTADTYFTSGHQPVVPRTYTTPLSPPSIPQPPI